MAGDRHRVYCAGPLFNEREREEMELIARVLATAGYDTFLPHRDGLELTKCIDVLVRSGFSGQHAARLMSEAIFALDVYQVLEDCDVVVANLNGRVPDEGTVSEAAIAWSRGKPVVGYKADTRTAFAGQDNPLVVGLFNFELCTSPDDVPAAVAERLKHTRDASAQTTEREREISSHLKLGQEIWRAMKASPGVDAVVEVLLGRSTALEESR